MDDMFSQAIQALTGAINSGVDIPSEFKPFVDQHLPGMRAQQARYGGSTEMLVGTGVKGIIGTGMGLTYAGEPPERAIMRHLGAYRVPGPAKLQNVL